MHAPLQEPPPTVRVRTPGEPLVWLTSVGLAAGLLMIVGLLGLIAWNGFAVFWPKRVQELKLVAQSKSASPSGPTVLGVVTQEKLKRVDGVDVPEIQVQIGNRDAFGQAFVFLDQADIAARSTPPDVLFIERLEYGPAFGYGVSLKLADGSVVPASAPDFRARLDALIAEIAARRAQIEQIERTEIGRLNAALADLKLQRKTLSPGTPTPDLDAREKALQESYEKLAARAGELRQQQNAAQFIYRLANGTEKTLPAGQLVHVTAPNQLGFLARVGAFFHNLRVFLFENPREANTEGGVFPAIFGTFVMTLLMSLAVTPFGVLAAIYLREYAHDTTFTRAVRIAINNLAGVPSIVFGVFGLGFFVYLVGGTVDRLFFSLSLPTPTFGTGGVLWAALTLALMTVPVVIVATEEALAAVPRGMREASLACGASKWQTIQRIVLPSAVPGILTGLILAMARGAGEVAPLMLVGVVKLAPTLPLDFDFPFLHAERKFMHLGFHIYDLGFQSPDSEAAKPMVYATTLLLIVLVVALNLGAILLRERLRRKYKTGVF
ncbi:MAG: phosphate ABC transporter permease PstA [Verrucomicrobia bacterium]|nr:phosphate ABC transporter permease PstA [Verrucomicrobiota bacterium]